MKFSNSYVANIYNRTYILNYHKKIKIIWSTLQKIWKIMKEKWSLHNKNKNIIGKNQKQMTNLKKLLKINIKKK